MTIAKVIVPVIVTVSVIMNIMAISVSQVFKSKAQQNLLDIWPVLDPRHDASLKGWGIVLNSGGGKQVQCRVQWVLHLGGCQNYGPFLGTLIIGCRTIFGTQKGTTILTTTQFRVCSLRSFIPMWTETSQRMSECIVAEFPVLP